MIGIHLIQLWPTIMVCTKILEPTPIISSTPMVIVKKHILRSSKGLLKKRVGKKYTNEAVEKEKIFALVRTYRRHSVQKSFTNTICRIKSITTEKFMKYCLVINAWSGEESTDFRIACHGNAKRNTARSTPFIRTEKKVLKLMEDDLKKGNRPESTYGQGIDNSGGPFRCSSKSTQPRNQKQMYNIQQSIGRICCTNNETDVNEDKLLKVVVEMRREEQKFIRNVMFTPDEYIVTAFDDQQLNEIEKLCVNQNKIIVMDTTFNVCDMWLTDIGYQNLRLVNDKGNHPWFYGPVLLHMRKTPETFSRFATEFLLANSKLRSLTYLGTDLERALFQGFKHVLPDLKSLLCVKHMSDRDKKKLTQLGAKGQKNFLADIYGINDGVVMELGLASAEDEDDFKAKLDSLKENWEDLAPTFHDWFSRNRGKQFIESVIESAREGSGLDGLFYNNAIESLHSILKMETGNKKLGIIELISKVKVIIQRQRTEEVRAVYQSGKYILANDYNQFQVDPITWHR
ncbi:uncharacterized protein LOC130629260 [Hydractinia symbiolongicarpus]|uniref:uncharacterized protein LOC130629260 n=1 Tax=Hydractinia symbiolongicarpus TaxID=13093 RepID=UPI002550D693|nr:uncharacterized protein LOC130629260 [Hydractinia symbiolongicarpus]